MRLTQSAVSLAASVADKPNHPENIWILAGLVVIVGVIGIALWARRYNRRNKG
jgi:hypothetical protein